jgi:hypothetical protein
LVVVQAQTASLDRLAATTERQAETADRLARIVETLIARV